MLCAKRIASSHRPVNDEREMFSREPGLNGCNRVLPRNVQSRVNNCDGGLQLFDPPSSAVTSTR